MSQILQLLNTANWRNVYNGQFSATPDPNGGVVPASVRFHPSKRILYLGVDCPVAEPRWWLGGIMDVSIVMQPSTTTSFSPIVEVCSQKLRINKAMIILLPQWIADTASYVVDLRMPNWVGGGYIECDEYIGPDNDSVSLQVQLVELKLDALNLKIP